MADKDIIFSAPMVRALLEGRKTQTRRADPPKPRFESHGCTQANLGGRACWWDYWRNDTSEIHRFKLKYAPGDRLYVREAWTARMTHGWTIADARSRMFQEEILYRADGHESDDGWWPSIHMPREFSRLTLTVTEVRVQRLQEISDDDALDEGCKCDSDGWRDYQHPTTQCCGTARESFGTLWNSLHGPDAWAANPWVVALTFTVQRGNIDQIGGAA